MVAALLLATTLFTQVQVQASTQTDSGKKSVTVGVRVGGLSDSTFRRTPVTAAHLATAFRDPLARTMLEGARKARVTQDSGLRSYDAKARQRMSVGMALKDNGRERLLARDEAVARIQWQRDAGAVVDLLGKRTTIPAAADTSLVDDGVRRELQLPIPYFPGKETLWIGASMAETSVNEENFVHPLAVGSEAYYRYSSGDSTTYTLSDGSKIVLRELRIEAREPHWNLIVGSFWFDAQGWPLVRAIYRPSIEMDIWQVADESAARNKNDREDAPPWWVKGLASPLKVTMNVFTVEYGLFNGRFWLPTSQGAEGRAQALMIRVPMNFEERYEYASVNENVDVAKPMADVPAPPRPRSEVTRDSLMKTGLTRTQADSVARARVLADSAVVNARARARRDSATARARAQRDSVERLGFKGKQIDSVLIARQKVRMDSIADAEKQKCLARGYSVNRQRAYRNTVDVLLRVPCDLKSLTTSPELPASAYDANEAVFDKKQRDELLDALDFGLQAGWGPQRIGLSYGFGQSRYNRVEGFSTGIAARQELGRGLAWTAKIRGSQGDKQLNGELGAERTNGRTVLGLNAYRRVNSVSDWGTPLTLSSSLPALLTGHDEGMYYRSWGAELTRTSIRGKRLDWRLFAEHDWSAPVTTRFSIFHGSHDPRFIENVHAERGNYVGGSVRWRQSWGLEPTSWNTLADFRLEGAGGTSNYGRLAVDLSTSHPLFGPLAFGITGAAGTSVGDLPAQRTWFLGGTSTVRGQNVKFDSLHTGNAFWFTRAELAHVHNASRRSVFADLGWVGSRDGDWGRSQRLMSGVGIGSSWMQGLIRTDLARGLFPQRGWRFNVTFEAPF